VRARRAPGPEEACYYKAVPERVKEKAAPPGPLAGRSGWLSGEPFSDIRQAPARPGPGTRAPQGTGPVPGAGARRPGRGGTGLVT